jgi:large subunit ribosomal protein L10
MAKTRQKKETEVKNLTDNFADAKAVVFTTFSNLSVADSQNLRSDLRKEGVSYLASKKTLLRKVLAEQEVGEINLADFSGNVGLAFGKEDEIAPAKIVAKFAKGREGFVIRGGILEGAFITAEKVMELAKLPIREELLAITVRTIQAPISGFVNVLAGNLRGLVNVLNAVKDSKQ